MSADVARKSARATFDREGAVKVCKRQVTISLPVIPSIA
jgi:hypothetical protein